MTVYSSSYLKLLADKPSLHRVARSVYQREYLVRLFNNQAIAYLGSAIRPLHGSARQWGPKYRESFASFLRRLSMQGYSVEFVVRVANGKKASFCRLKLSDFERMLIDATRENPSS